MGSRLMEESLARGVPACIRVRDMGCSSCRSRFLKSAETFSCRETEERESETEYWIFLLYLFNLNFQRWRKLSDLFSEAVW